MSTHCSLLLVAYITIVAMLFAPAALGEHSVEAVVPETEFAQVEKLKIGSPFGVACNIDVQQCFAKVQYSPTECQACEEKCHSMAQNLITSCKQNCKSKCTWTKATTEFKGSYYALCTDEILVKNERAKKAKKKKEAAAKHDTAVERKAKGAFEGLSKCKHRESGHKKTHEQYSKVMADKIGRVQEVDSKLSKQYQEASTKQHKKAMKQEAELNRKEMQTKESQFKTVKEAKDKSEANVKSLKEKIFKKAKITQATQENIYKEWKGHLAIVKIEKLRKAKISAAKEAKLKAKAKASKPAPKKKFTIVEKKPNALPIPEEKCKCNFPFVYNGFQYFKCASGNDGSSFCVDAKNRVQNCPKSCAAVWCKTLPKAKSPVPKPPPPAPTPVPAPPPPVKPTIFKPAPSIYEIRIKNENLQLSLLKQKLVVAKEKSDKAAMGNSEKKDKAGQKLENLNKMVAIKTSSEKSTKKEGVEKPLMEKRAKKMKAKETSTKESNLKRETKNKFATVQAKRESAGKVDAFKSNEVKSKDAAKERKKKDPFLILQTYYTKIQHMKENFYKTKESESKQMKELARKKVAHANKITAENNIKKKEIISKQCRQTKEVCDKIHRTSEKKGKHASVLARESKTKLQAKFALTLKMQKIDQKNMRFAVCAAAHKQLKHVIKTIQSAETQVVKKAQAVTTELQDEVQQAEKNLEPPLAGHTKPAPLLAHKA